MCEALEASRIGVSLPPRTFFERAALSWLPFQQCSETCPRRRLLWRGPRKISPIRRFMATFNQFTDWFPTTRTTLTASCQHAGDRAPFPRTRCCFCFLRVDFRAHNCALRGLQNITLPQKLVEDCRGQAPNLRGGRNLRPQIEETCQKRPRLYLSSKLNPASS